MEKINPALYITDTDPRTEAVMSASDWYETETMSLSLGLSLTENEGTINWYAAQGWRLVNYERKVVNVNATTTITTMEYTLRRRYINTENALNDLISSYTAAYNDGRELNDTRYDEIITIYCAMLDKTEDELITEEEDRDDYEDLVELIIDELRADHTAFSAVINALLTSMQASHNTYDTLISAFDTTASSDHSAYDTLINALLTTIQSDHTDHETAITAMNTNLSGDYDSYSALVDAVVTLVQSDYTTHSALVETLINSLETEYTAFSDDMEDHLDGYGDSIRDQINTRFDNKLTSTRQDLTSRGMYNSTVWDSISTGIERERTLALNDVEDKITQQQLTLKQNIRADQVAMRNQILTARDRLFAQLNNVRTHADGAYDRLRGAKQDMRNQVIGTLERLQEQLRSVHGTRLAGKDKLHAVKTDMRNRVQSAKDKLQAHLDMVYERRVTAQERLYATKADLLGKILAARDRLRDSLDSAKDRRLAMRNAIIEALMGFMERRTDSYPDLGEIGQLASNLGAATPSTPTG